MRIVARLVVLGTVVACGAGYAAGDGPVDASTPPPPPVSDDGGAPADAASEAAPCDLASPFGAAVPITELGDPSATDQAAHLTADELSIFFASDRDAAGGDSSIWTASRARRTDRFGAPSPVALSTASPNTHPAISADGLTMVYAENTAGEWDLYRTQRVAVTAPFEASEKLALSLPGVVEYGPYLAPSGDLYFASNRAGDGGVRAQTHIFRATKVGADFGAPEAIDLGASEADAEFFPVVSSDGLTLYTTRRSPGHPDGDIYVSTRPSTQVAFPQANLLIGFASASIGEYSGWISPDGCRLYMSIANGGTPDLYVASRP